MNKVIIASKNPIKIEAVRVAFATVFPEISYTYEGVQIPSGVADQPLSSQETVTGAVNRASGAQEQYPDAVFWVGIEGGLELTEDGMESFAWVVVISQENIGKAKSATFYLPEKIVKLIRAGKELGEADDIIFGMHNSKQQTGAVGILTNNTVTRTSFYSEAVVLALIPHIHSDLY